MADRRELFDFMLDRVNYTRRETGKAEPQAFGLWFLRMYFQNPQNVYVSDGAHDGKVDIFFTTDDGRTVTHHILNTKYTREYNKQAPAQFYEEVLTFWQVFENKEGRDRFLEKSVKPELRPHYRKLFEAYDREAAKLVFVTNYRRNDDRSSLIENARVETFHLDDLVQHIIDDIDGAMPRTPRLTLTGINTVLAAHERDSEVPTSIIFAKLTDFIKYMQTDPYDLLFMRNVRVAINPSQSVVNKAIRDTFANHPEQFAYSNNGITVLCEKHTHFQGTKELVLENPRVVNGSQTLHSIRDVSNPSPKARVMVRIIEIPIPTSGDLESRTQRRKEVINRIAIRSNQQNPIKKWDLVSNDDFQMTLYRFFRQRGYFYERRLREWRRRSRELRSVGIERGPNIKLMAQLIASYFWNKKKLGPANARQPGDLFEGTTYEEIQRTSPELVYQLWWVWDYMHFSYSDLAEQYRYIYYLKGYINLTLFALVTKAIQSTGYKWGQIELTNHLESKDGLWPTPAWRKFLQECVKLIKAIYDKEAKAQRKREGYELTHANFFKSPSLVYKILRAPLSRKMRKLAYKALDS